MEHLKSKLAGYFSYIFQKADSKTKEVIPLKPFNLRLNDLKLDMQRKTALLKLLGAQDREVLILSLREGLGQLIEETEALKQQYSGSLNLQKLDAELQKLKVLEAKFDAAGYKRHDKSLSNMQDKESLSKCETLDWDAKTLVEGIASSRK